MAYSLTSSDDDTCPLNRAFLEPFFCAFSRDMHIVINPIALSCGHNACYKCIILNDYNQESSNTNTNIKCSICNEIIHGNPKASKESDAVKRLINQNLETIYSCLDYRYRTSFEQLQSCKQAFDQKNDMIIQRTSDEIKRRIDAMKCEIDKLGKDMMNELRLYKETMLKKKSIEQIDLNQYAVRYAEMREQEPNEIKLYEYQNDIIKLNELSNKYSTADDLQIEFKPSEFLHRWLHIGVLNSNIQNDHSNEDDLDYMSDAINFVPKKKVLDEVKTEILDIHKKLDDTIKAFTKEQENFKMTIELLDSDIKQLKTPKGNAAKNKAQLTHKIAMNNNTNATTATSSSSNKNVSV